MPPKQKLLDPSFYDDVVADVQSFLRERMRLAVDPGRRRRADPARPGPGLRQDPGPDGGEPASPRHAPRARRPILLAISRKDFVGAITGRPPRERLAGTLAALAYGADAGGHVFRVHDVAAAADFLAVRAVLQGETELESAATLAEELRREPTV